MCLSSEEKHTRRYGCVITAIRSAGDERTLESGTLQLKSFSERRRGEHVFTIDIPDINLSKKKLK